MKLYLVMSPSCKVFWRGWDRGRWVGAPERCKCLG